MKISILTVGTGRDVEKGLAHSISAANPDHIYLLCSEASKETCEKIIQEANKDREAYTVHSIDEINDVERLYKSYSEYVEQIFAQHVDNAFYVIDFTSGTKAMSAAIVAVAIEKNISTISYVYGERGEGGRVISGSERVHTLQPNSIHAARTIKQAKQFFNIYQYEAAVALLASLSDYHKGEQGRALIKLAKAYNARDKFDFEKAKAFFSEVEDSIGLVSTSIVKKSLKTVKLLASEEAPFKLKGPELIRELWFNAERRAEHGNYDDATARLYRLLELIGQVSFYRHFGYKTSDVPVNDKLPEHLKPSNPKQKEIKLGLRQVFEYLADEGVQEGKMWAENWSDIEKIIGNRNHSILAHGLDAVDEEMYNKFRVQVDKFLPDNLQEVQFPTLKP
ncbi:MAG: CRISPR-associated protein (TIGR02710 family) [Neolewinella sp.]|jgi:CRISPR-associated protein (TIGR02710 family)